MVGELENLSRLGKRSDFITKAIRSKLDGEDSFSIEDYETNRLAVIFHNRLHQQLDDTPLCGLMRAMLLEWINQ